LAIAVFLLGPLGPVNSYAAAPEAKLTVKQKIESAQASCAANFDKFVGSPLSAFAKSLRRYDSERPSLFAAQYLYHLSTSAVPLVPEKAAGSFFDKGKNLLARGSKGALRILLPVPVPKRRTEVEKIFLKLWKDPAYEPSQEEWKILRESETESLFAGRKKFLQANPKASLVRPAAGFGAGGLLYLSAAAALNQAREMSENTQTLNAYLDSPNEDEEGKPTVQLIVETTPFPHTALRIGDKVYSYGVEYMTSRGFTEYVLGAAPATKSAEPDKNNFYSRLTDTGAKSMARAMRVTDLNLTPEQVNKLRRELEMNTGKAYDNRTFINDCATMIKRALEVNSDIRIPGVIDPLPSVSSAYLSMRKALGDNQVGITKMVTENTGGALKNFTVARNAYIGMMEGKIALVSAPFNLPVRGYMDLFKKDEDLQFHTPEVKAEILKWQENARASLAKEVEEALGGPNFAESLRMQPESASKAKRVAAARNLLESIFERNLEEAKEILAFPRAEFQDIIVATEKVETLERMRASLLDEINQVGSIK
jgi:hypothetical protein